MQFVRLVFLRIYQQQLRIMQDPFEAAYVSVIYMSIGPMLFVMFLDILAAWLFDTRPVMMQTNKWIYVGTLSVLSFWTHWNYFIRHKRVDKIIKEFSSSHPYNVSATTLAYGYVLGPCILALLAGKVLGTG